MPNYFPGKPRSRAIRADEFEQTRRQFRNHQPRGHDVFENIDWLALWALSLGLCAVVLAGLAFFSCNDGPGAAAILTGAGVIIAATLSFSRAPGRHD